MSISFTKKKTISLGIFDANGYVKIVHGNISLAFIPDQPTYDVVMLLNHQYVKTIVS